MSLDINSGRVERESDAHQRVGRGVIFGLGRTNHFALGLHELGVKHLDYGVEPSHYGVFPQAMLDTIEEIIGRDAYTPRGAEAWGATIDMMLWLIKMVPVRQNRGAVS